jgi:hypothetical protein
MNRLCLPDESVGKGSPAPYVHYDDANSRADLMFVDDSFSFLLQWSNWVEQVLVGVGDAGVERTLILSPIAP